MDPPCDRPWRATHAMLPCAIPVDDDHFRVYFSGRDASGRSSISAGLLAVFPKPVWLELDGPPLLLPGETAAFDGAGVSVSFVTGGEQEIEVWYHGWSLGCDVPWWNSIGLAAGPAGRELRRASRAPVFDRSEEDPFSLAYPFIVEIGGVEQLWYSSYRRWARVGDTPPMEYVVKRATRSEAGWISDGEVLSPNPPEIALSRPCVIQEPDLVKAWFAVKEASDDLYRIGYAESTDGNEWERFDDVGGLVAAGEGGEVGEVTYPWVVDSGGRRWMFYNGDGYGRTGFGIAVWHD